MAKMHKKPIRLNLPLEKYKIAKMHKKTIRWNLPLEKYKFMAKMHKKP